MILSARPESRGCRRAQNRGRSARGLRAAWLKNGPADGARPEPRGCVRGVHARGRPAGGKIWGREQWGGETGVSAVRTIYELGRGRCLKAITGRPPLRRSGSRRPICICPARHTRARTDPRTRAKLKPRPCPAARQPHPPRKIASAKKKENRRNSRARPAELNFRGRSGAAAPPGGAPFVRPRASRTCGAGPVPRHNRPRAGSDASSEERTRRAPQRRRRA